MIYLFDNQEKLIQVISKTSIKELIHTQELKDTHISDYVYASIKALSNDLIQEVEYLAISAVDDPYKFHFMYVTNIKTEHNFTEIDAVQAGIEELRKSAVEDRRLREATARTMAEAAVEHTNWTISYVADTGTSTLNFYYINRFEALTKVMERFGLEAQFFIEIEGNKIGARYIEVKEKIGKNVGKRVVYGHNALKIVHEVDKVDIVTALIGRGKGEDLGYENKDGDEVYGRKINFSDVEWSIDKGDPVDKPLGQKYVEIPEATAQYGIVTPEGNRPKVGIIDFDQEEDVEKLLKKTYEVLEDVSRPQVLFETDTVYLDADVGDVIRVARPDRNIDYSVRVISVKRNRLLDNFAVLKLGDKISGGDERRFNQLSNKIKDLELESIQRINEMVDKLPSASGFNTNFYTKDDPREKYPSGVKIGDLWFKPDPEHGGEYILQAWNGEIWVEYIRTKNWNAVTKELSDIIKRAEALEQENQATQGELSRLSEELFWTAKKSDLAVNVVGEDGLYLYPKNRLNILELEDPTGVTEYTFRLEDRTFKINHNGAGFTAGQPYTLSFDAKEIERANSKVVLNFAEDV